MSASLAVTVRGVAIQAGQAAVAILTGVAVGVRDVPSVRTALYAVVVAVDLDLPLFTQTVD
jgi:hypothetical protein